MRGLLGEPSFRQLAAAPELISPSARVTTTTTPTTDPIDDACSEERVEPMQVEAYMWFRGCSALSSSSSVIQHFDALSPLNTPFS